MLMMTRLCKILLVAVCWFSYVNSAWAQSEIRNGWNAPAIISSGGSATVRFGYVSTVSPPPTISDVRTSGLSIPDGASVRGFNGCAIENGQLVFNQPFGTELSCEFVIQNLITGEEPEILTLPDVDVFITAMPEEFPGVDIRLAGRALPELSAGTGVPSSVFSGARVDFPVVLSRTATSPVTVTFSSSPPSIFSGTRECTIQANNNGCTATLTAAEDINVETSVTVTASAAQGATGTARFDLTVLPREQLTVFSGNGQSAFPGESFQAPLVVEFRREGSTVAGQSVRFQAMGNANVVGTLQNGPSGVPMLECLNTDANGRCSVNARAGSNPGDWTVQASVQTGSGTKFVTFNLTNRTQLGALVFEGGEPTATVATIGTRFFNADGTLRVRSPGGGTVNVTVDSSPASVQVTPASCPTIDEVCVFTVQATQVPGTATLRFTSTTGQSRSLTLDTVGAAAFTAPPQNGQITSSSLTVSVTRAGSAAVAFPQVIARNRGSSNLLSQQSSCQPSGSGDVRTCMLSLDVNPGLIPNDYPFELVMTLPGFSAQTVTRALSYRVTTTDPPPVVRTLTITSPAPAVLSFQPGAPFSVAALLTEGTPAVAVPGQTLQFAVNPSSCATFVAASTCVTDASGVCEVSLTAGLVTGCSSYTISVQGGNASNSPSRTFANISQNPITIQTVGVVPRLLAPDETRVETLVIEVRRGDAVQPNTAVSINFLDTRSDVLTAVNVNRTTGTNGQATFQLRGRSPGSRKFKFRVAGIDLNPEFTVEVSNAASVGTGNEASLTALLANAAGPDVTQVDRIALAAAGSLGRLCASAQADSNVNLRASCDALIRAAEVQSGHAAARESLRALSGEEARNLSDAAYSMSQDRSQLLQQRLAAVRGGAGSGFAADSLSLSSGAASMSLGQLGALASALTADGSTEAASDGDTQGPWGSYVMGSYVRSNVGSVGVAREHDFTNYNLLAGADYRHGDGIVIGAALGVSRGDLGYGGRDLGGQDVESSSLSFYGTRSLTSGGLFEAALSLARYRFDYVREVNLQGIGHERFVNVADVDADEMSLLLNFSYPMTMFGTQLAPEFGMVGSTTSINRFVERDLDQRQSNIWLLEVPDHDYSSLQSRIALRAERSFTLESESVISVNGSLQGYYELLDGRGVVTPTFAGLSNASAPSFQLNERSTSYGILDFGLSWRNRRGVSLQMTGGAYLGLEKTDRFYFNLGGSYSF